MEVYLIVGMAVMIYTLVTVLLNCECWNPEFQKCACDECKCLCRSAKGKSSVFSLSSQVDVEKA